MTESEARCPICGFAIPSGIITDNHITSVRCPRCRTLLEVATPTPAPLLAASVVLSAGLCFTLGFRGIVLAVLTIAVAAVLYWLAKSLRSIVSAPKLQKSPSGDKLLGVAKR